MVLVPLWAVRAVILQAVPVQAKHSDWAVTSVTMWLLPWMYVYFHYGELFLFGECTTFSLLIHRQEDMQFNLVEFHIAPE